MFEIIMIIIIRRRRRRNTLFIEDAYVTIVNLL